MTLDLIIILSLSAFILFGFLLAGLFYLLFKLDKVKHPERHEFIPPMFTLSKRTRSHKYVMNNFTKRIFFGKPQKNNRIKVLNTYSPLETEKYSFK